MSRLSTAGVLGTENVGQVWPFKEKQLCTEARLYIQRAVADQSAGGHIKRFGKYCEKAKNIFTDIDF